MHKPTENRSHSWADNKQSIQNPHLSDEQLLLALDGELSAQEATRVDVHVASCWSCRARRDQIEKAIREVVEYRDHLIQPYFPIPTGRRARFVTRLEELARTAARPPLWSRILKALRVFESIAQDAIPRHAWTVVMVLGGLSFFLYLRLWETPKVSASQFLVNAQASEVRALHSLAKPVVYQKLRIQIDNQAVTRTIYSDPVGKRQGGRLDVDESDSAKADGNKGLRSQPGDRTRTVKVDDAELRRTFLTAHLSWEDPLSPANYSAWYKSLDEKLDEVTEIGDKFITLKTTTSEGPIAEASITVRTADFHPVAEDLRLQDARRVEVHELAWEILPMEAVNEAIFEPEATPNGPNRRPPTVLLKHAGVTDAELAEAELRVRVAIHAEKADLGEPIELDRDIPRSGPTSVVVRGIVSTPARKNDILAALQGIPHVELRLQTIEEAQVQQDQIPTDEPHGPAPLITQGAPVQEYGVASEGVEPTRHETIAIVGPGRSAFEQQLEGRFPNSKDRTAFVNETIESVQDAMAEAWALRRLTYRYTPDAVAELSSGSQQTLELLIRDHVSALRQDVNELRVQVMPLLPSTFISAAPQPVFDASLSTKEIASDWRGTVMSVFSEMQKVNDNGGALLAGASETLSDPQTVVRKLQLALAELDTQLVTLYQQVSGPFLSVPIYSDR
jgi:hypothetical protein